MVLSRNKMKTETKDKLRDGEGATKFTYLVDAEKEKNIRLLAELVLEPGCSIGYHDHVNETEYYLIVKGTGTVNDNGVETKVGPGDAVITGNGDSHNIKNTGTAPLVFHAIIVTH